MPNAHHVYLNNLTPLRGMAALWVAAYHFEISTIGSSHYDHSLLLGKGYLMVDLFFIMSGFIIRHVYGDSFSRRITIPDFRRFIVARFARIYPLHFFTLTFLIVMAFFTGEWNWVNDPNAIPTNLLLLQSFGVNRLSTWNRVSWSISAEWAAYMIFPLLAFLINRTPRITLPILPFLIILTYIALLYWLPPAGIGNADRLLLHKLDVTYDYGFLRGIAGFLVGMLCYGLYNQFPTRSFFSKDSMGMLCIAATLLLMHKGSNDLFLIPAFSGLTVSFAANAGILHKFCSFKPMQFVGKVSYSIYLIQAIAMLFYTFVLEFSGLTGILPPLSTTSFLPRLLYTITYLVFLVGLSSATYYGVENPCRNYINRNYLSKTPVMQ